MDTCLNCNQPVKEFFKSGKAKKYCSEKCMTDYNSKHRAKQERLPKKRNCKFCEKEIISKSVYCSIECRKAYNKANHKTYLLCCEACGIMYESKIYNGKYCTEACRKVASVRNRTIVKICDQCGNEYKSYNDTHFCSPACVGEHQRLEAIEKAKDIVPRHIFPSRRARQSYLRRKRQREQWVEDVKVEVLVERDKGICQLCGTPVRLDVHYTHPLAPTRDHIVPLSMGGEHSYANCQLACRDCNTIKNNRVEVNLIDPTKQKRKSATSKIPDQRRNQCPN